MGKWSILLLFALGSMATAQTPMPIPQFEKLLKTLQHKSDRRAAESLARIELTERVNPANLARWQADSPGQNSRNVLLAIADASAFLDPPFAELPDTPAPDSSTQAQILARAMEYVRTMRPRLPNFSARRTATYFERSTPAQIMGEERMLQIQQMSKARLGYKSLGSTGVRGQNLFLVGTVATVVTNREGAEVQTVPEFHGKHAPMQPRGLTSSGEFGAILSVVDLDPREGHLVWDHWEAGPASQFAVFRYSVTKAASHFAVSSNPGIPGAFPSESNYLAYHGEIAIDPTTGAVYRIVIQTDADPDAPTDQSGMVVEYAPVVIGEKTYVCPVHGVARSTPASSPSDPLRTFLNDVTFTGYHLFRSESRIIP